MHAVKLTIPGEFWDSQVYSGRLFLFGFEGELISVDWNRLVRSLAVPADLKVVTEVSFLNSALFYEQGARRLVNDPVIKPLIQKKFLRLAQTKLVSDNWQSFATYYDNPFPFPHTDSDIHYGDIYVSAHEGLFVSDRRGQSTRSGRRSADRKWDAPLYGLSASQRTVAVAAGEEGLFEHKISGPSQYEDPSVVASSPCTMCDWALYSIYATSHISAGYLAAYEMVKPEGGGESSRKTKRRFDSLFSADELFEEHGGDSFSWGIGDKIYQYKSGKVHILRYVPSPRKGEETFTRLGEVAIDSWKGNAVSASAAPFGTVVEFDNALVVMMSTGKNFTIEGEPVKWRVFNKTNLYRNQLHVIHDDRIDIWSFDQDYFVNQRNKLVGTYVSSADIDLEQEQSIVAA